MDASLDEECWEYLDPKSVKRGPFSGARMAVWFEHQLLPEDLGVRHGSSMPFIPIKELFYPPLIPFRSRPRPCAVQAATAKCQCQWQYRDNRGQLQGPFTSAQMALWYEHGMLPTSLQLRRTTDAVFAAIADYFPTPLEPFQNAPVNPVPPGVKEEQQLRKDASAALAAAIGMGKAPVAKPPAPLQQVGGLAAGALTASQLPQAAQPLARAPPQPVKGQGTAVPKGGKMNSGKGGQGPEVGYPGSEATGDGNEKGSGGKGGGKGAGPIGGAAARAPRGKQAAVGGKEQVPSQPGQLAQVAWNEQAWSGNDKAWWEWSAWNGWSGEGGVAGGADWEHNGKQLGVEWNGKGDAAVPQKDKGEKGAAAVQAAFDNLRWGPFTEAGDLYPEECARRIQDEGILWEERWISPLLVRFSQGKIHPFFHERGPISEVMLQIRLRDESTGALKRIEPPFPPVRLLYLKEQGVLVTLDNRRLYALQRFALQEWPSICLVRALCVDELTPTRLRAENRKFTNRLCGLQLEVESRSNAFETFSWVTEAAHSEAPRFCRPAALRAVDKSISLLPVLVVHTLLCQRLRPLLRSRWPLLRFVALHLGSPQRREFLSKRLLFQHVLELARPSRQVCTCPPVCVAYKAETVVTLSKGKSCVTSKLNVTKPLALLKAQAQPLSDVQRQVLAAMLPLFCLPYARSALKGNTRDWVIGFLLAWGKMATAALRLPQYP